MPELQENLSIILQTLTLLGIIFAIHRSVTDPDNKAKNRLDIMETVCPIRHNSVDGVIETMQGEITLIKENHLRHIEKDIAEMKGDMKAILAVLNDRQSRN